MQHAPGCFGSMIAYQHKSPPCQRCKARVECAAEVAAIRPTVIRVLDKFSDSNGRSMAWEWLTRGERAERKKRELDEDLTVLGLVVDADQHAAPIARRAAKRGIDVRAAKPAQLAGLAPAISTIVQRLESGPVPYPAIVEAVALDNDYSQETALRKTRAMVKFLTAHGRVRRTDNILELL